MRRTVKHSMAWLLLLLLLAACTPTPAPELKDTRERVPSPTSALSEEGLAPVSLFGASSEGIQLQFTEVRTSGDKAGAYAGCEAADWFELCNLGAATVDLGRLYVTDNPEKPDKYRLPQVDLRPGQYLAICCCEKSHPSVPMGIARRGETLYLFGGDGREICTVTVPPLEADMSWAYLDGAWGYCTEPTPGSANGRIFTSLDPVKVDSLGFSLSELLIDGKYAAVTPDGQYCDFVEFRNDSPADISLQNWFLSDGEDDLDKWPFPDVTVPAGGYLLVLLGGDGQPRADGLLQADFSLNRREQVVLYDADALSYTTFDLPPVIRSDVSVSANGEYYFVPTPGRENGLPSYTAADKGCYDYTGVFISEVCAYAGAGNNDWIELYNATDAQISLEGWQLAKDRGGEKAIPLSGILAPGGYAVYETTSHPERQQGGVGDFGLSMGGETLYLLDETGALRDRFLTGALEPDISSGRVEGNGNIARVFFTKPTKGGRNSDRYAMGYAKAPVFSMTDLYQTSAFLLTLTSGEDATIRYTTNGTEPSDSSPVYTGPIEIGKNTVVRAFAQEDGLLDNEIVTYTFLFEEPHELPVICLSFDPKDKDALWSGRSKDSSSKKQRKGYFSYYEGGKLSTEFPADFKTKGAGTLGYAQASLSIHLRGKYGMSSVTYPFFKEYGWQSFSSLCIRNSGQDINQARIRDSFAARLCFGLNIDVAATRPVVVYINGKYYGLYDLNEDQNDDFLQSRYDIDKDDVEIIRFNTVVVKGGNHDWKRVIEYAKNKDFSKDSVYEQFIQWVDPDYFIDYLVCSTYLCNSDMANQKYWHTTDGTVRWRAIFYDFDYAMGYNSGSVKRNIIGSFFSKNGTATATSRVYTYIAAALVHNPGWRQRFIERYVELTVTTFAPERATRILNELKEEMAPEMKRHIARWKNPSSYDKWVANVNAVQHWMEQRPKYALDNLRSYFKLSQSEIDALIEKYTP